MRVKPRVFRNAFGPVALLAFQPVASCIRALSTGKSSFGDEDGESIESLLPSQLLLALAALIICAVNTPVQRLLVELTLVLVRPFIVAASLSVRRSALAASLSAVQALSQSGAWQSKSKAGSVGALAMLSNLSGCLHEKLHEVVGGLEAVMSLVEACLARAAVEADPKCRALLAAVVRSAVALGEGDP